MINENDAIVTVTGDTITRASIVQDMINLFNKKYPESRITDFNEGSQIRNILESISVAVFHLMMNNYESTRVGFLETSYGEWLDLLGLEIGLARYTGERATGTVTFSLPSPAVTPVTIPTDTYLVAENGMVFLTIPEVTIPVGESSCLCPVIALIEGEGGNIPSGTLNEFYQTIINPLLSVTNEDEFFGGSDRESDLKYRERLVNKKSVTDFSSKPYYMTLGANIEGVHDVILIDDENYTTNVIVNGDTKPVDDDVYAECIRVFTDEFNRSLKHKFTFTPASFTPLDLNIEIIVEEEITDTTIFTDVLTGLLNGGRVAGVSYPGHDINQDVTRYSLVSALESITGVVDIASLTDSDDLAFSRKTPVENTVFILGEVNITQITEE